MTSTETTFDARLDALLKVAFRNGAAAMQSEAAQRFVAAGDYASARIILHLPAPVGPGAAIAVTSARPK